MSSQKFKSNSYCVGGRHKPGTKNIDGGITFNKKNRKRDQIIRWKMCDL